MPTWVFVLWLLGGVVLLPVVAWLQVTFNLLRTRVTPPRHVLVDEDDVPPHLRDAVLPVKEALAAAGFAPWGWSTSRAPVADGDAGLALLMLDETRITLAVVLRASVPERGRFAQVYLESAFADGGSALTFDHAVPATLQSRREGDVIGWTTGGGVASLVAAHGAALRSACPPRRPASLSGGEWLARYDHEELRRLRVDERAGRLVRESDGWRPSFVSAVRAALSIVGASLPFRRATPPAGTEESGAPVLHGSPVVPPEALLADAFRVFDETWRRPLPARVARVLFVSTFAVSALAFSAWLGPSTAALVMAVLLLHEGGHLAAMLAFGYRNPRVFFVPFLGAAVSGDGAHASALQRALVLLAGPVPGLLLGTALLSSEPGAGWLRTAALLLVAVNALNLLPVVPLDGGQLWSGLVFARRPMWEVLFRGAAGVLLVWAGLRGDPPVALVGALVCVTLPVAWRRARLTQYLRSLEGDDAGRVARGLSWIVETWPRRPVAHAFALMRLARRDGVPDHPGPVATVTMLVLWAGFVALAVRTLAAAGTLTALRRG